MLRLRGAEQSSQVIDVQSGSQRAQRRDHLAGNGGGGVFQQRADGIGSRRFQASQSPHGLRAPARQRVGQRQANQVGVLPGSGLAESGDRTGVRRGGGLQVLAAAATGAARPGDRPSWEPSR
jgi:hypothetical protein